MRCDQLDLLNTLILPGQELTEQTALYQTTTGQQIVGKGLGNRPYVPRLKALGEIAYSLFDQHLEGERVAPDVCATNKMTLWRTYMPGQTGDKWRGTLYRDHGSLELADQMIFDTIRLEGSAERIALLDWIFLPQDRSGANWTFDQESGRFYAIDNGMLWSYLSRHVDRYTIQTGSVDHLNPPVRDVLIKHADEPEYGIGIFTDTLAGRSIDRDLLGLLNDFNWIAYSIALKDAIQPLDYPAWLANDWRFTQVKQRGEWLIEHGQFPSVHEIFRGDWRTLIDVIPFHEVIWEPKWEA
jgi:hypothetical protein